MNTIQETIQLKLDEIEKQENVRIIHCVESGSRAWGFASPDSDYDVRFIYVRSPEFYYKLEKTRDVIEWQLDDTLDINGWDLQKTLRLLHQSNPTLFEWNQSPIVYRSTEEWEEVSKIINKYFLLKSGLYHYISTAKGNYREYLRGERVKLKKYFYVLRPLLACRWILADQTPPPMLFSTLSERFLEGEIRQAVDDLVEIKRATPEIGEGDRIEIINNYIDESFEEIEAAIRQLPPENKQGWEELNKVFRTIVTSV